MINFIYQLDWIMGCPYSWLNIISSVSVRVFLDKISIEGGLSKVVCPPQCGGRGEIQSLKGLTGKKKAKKEDFDLSCPVAVAGRSVSCSRRDWFSGLQLCTGIHISFPGS